MSVKCILTGQQSVTQEIDPTVPAWAKEANKPTYTAEEVGALAIDGVASSATKLATSRTIKTNLASSSSAGFNGTANITPGVTGVLPIKNGGTGVSSVEELKNLIQYNVLSFDWGNEDEIGDSTWWSNLKQWILSSSPTQRQLCIGKKKKVSLQEAILETSEISMICIGADQDGLETLTFQTYDTLAKPTKFTTAAPPLWETSTARILCNDFGIQCSASNAIKIVTKLTSSACNSNRDNPADIETNDKCWILSEQEMGQNSSSPSRLETTKGIENIGYLYYTSDEKRKKEYRIKTSSGTQVGYASYWTRSRQYQYVGNLMNRECIVTTTGGTNNVSYAQEVYLAPAFVIG